jgi:hypothetical protein
MNSKYYYNFDSNLQYHEDNIQLKPSSIYVPISLSIGLFLLILLSAYCIYKNKKKSKIVPTTEENKQNLYDSDRNKRPLNTDKIESMTEKQKSIDNRSNGYKDNMINKKNIFETSVHFLSQLKINTKHTLASSNSSNLNLKQSSKNESRIIKLKRNSNITIRRSRDYINRIIDDTIKEERKTNVILDTRSLTKKINITIDSKLNDGFVENSGRNSIQQEENNNNLNTENKSEIISTHILGNVNYKEIKYADFINSKENQIKISFD